MRSPKPNPAPALAPSTSGAPATWPDAGADRVAAALFAAALLVGLLRFWRLGDWSLWIDEALTFSDALHGQGAINPLGYWIYEAWLGLWSQRADEWLLRLPAAVFGFLSIGAAAWAFRPLAGARAAAGAALLLAASSWHIYHSQNARFYTLAALLALVGAGVFVRGLKGQRVWLLLLGLALSASSALAHPTALLVVLGLVLAPLLLAALGLGFGRRVTRTLLLVAAAAPLFGLGWAGDLLERWQNLRGSGNPAHFALAFGYHLSPALAAGALVGGLWALGARHSGMLFPLLVALAGAAAAGTMALFARMTAQYVFALLPWFALLCALPLGAGAVRSSDPIADRALGPRQTGGRATGAERWLGPAVLVLVLLPSLVSSALYLSVRHGERPRWRDAYAHVFEHRREGDLIFGMAAPVGEYYLSARGTRVREPVELVYLDRFRADLPGRWDRRSRRAWFVLNKEELFDWSAEQRAELRRLLREDCRLVAHFPLEVESRDLSVWVYLRE